MRTRRSLPILLICLAAAAILLISKQGDRENSEIQTPSRTAADSVDRKPVYLQAAVVAGEPVANDLPEAAPPSANRVSKYSDEASRDCEAKMLERLSQVDAEELRILTAAQYLAQDSYSYSLADRSTIESLVAQGDTTAMLALAELEKYAAQGYGENANWQRRQQARSPDAPNSLTPEQQEHRWENALHWYYAAALNGRAMALMVYGQTLAQMNKDAVALGWVSETDFAALSAAEKRALNPAVVYYRLARRLAPEAYNLALQPVLLALPESEFPELHEGIILQLEETFFDALDAGGHSVPDSIAGQFPSYGEAMSGSCVAAAHF